MKKNLLTAVAVMVSAFFLGTTIAEAAGVSFGGQLRPRYNINEQNDFNSDSDPNDWIDSRIRLNAKADILPDTSAFIQLQSVRTWGNNLDADTDAKGPGSGNAALTASDGDSSVGVHQAYFTVKNFATLPADLQFGRQEVVLDGHRLLGNTGWTQGAQTHDAIRLTHAAGNHTVALVYSRANDAGVVASGDDSNDNQEMDVYVLWGNMKGILGGALSLYFIAVDDDCSPGTICSSTDAAPLNNDLYLVGLRQAGQLMGLDYRGEFYYEFGDAEGEASRIGTGAYTQTAFQDIDREAYMFGLRLGKKFNNVMWKPSLTLWYDYLSGTTDEDARSGDFKSFDTIFDTGHKFYGFMDQFLGVGGGATDHLGLVDYAIKTKFSPAAKWTVKADWHYFTTAEGVVSNPNLSGSTPGGSDDNSLGHELDVTFVHKYNSNVTISAGYSQFWNEASFRTVVKDATASGRDTASWGYVMFDVKF